MSIEKRLNAKSTLYTFIPTTIVGAIAMGYAQHLTYAETASVTTSIAAGLTAQTIARSVAVLPSHAFMSRRRLQKETGGYHIGTYAQEMVAIATSAKILYAPWLTSLTATNAYLLSQEYSHLHAGTLSSATTGAAYAVTLAFGSPQINNCVDWVKQKIKQLKKPDITTPK